MLPVSWDNRRFLDRLRRVQLYEICNHFSVPFKMGATAISMRDSLEAHDVSEAQITQYLQEKGRLQVVHGQDENGRHHTELYPAVPEHHSARVLNAGGQIDYDAAIAANAEKVAEKDAVIEEQTGVMENLMAMMADLKMEIADLKENTIGPENMTPAQLKGLAKRKGLDIRGINKKDDLLRLINGEDAA